MTPMSFSERMVRVHDVAWSGLPSGGYYVEWTQDGVREFRTFRTPGAAQELAAWLSTTPQPTVAEVQAAERSLRDLEETMKMVSGDKERIEALRELGVPMASPRQKKRSEKQLRELERALGTMSVRRHVRRRKRAGSSETLK